MIFIVAPLVELHEDNATPSLSNVPSTSLQAENDVEVIEERIVPKNTTPEVNRNTRPAVSSFNRISWCWGTGSEVTPEDATWNGVQRRRDPIRRDMKKMRKLAKRGMQKVKGIGRVKAGKRGRKKKRRVCGSGCWNSQLGVLGTSIALCRKRLPLPRRPTNARSTAILCRCTAR